MVMRGLSVEEEWCCKGRECTRNGDERDES
jgi:hypothetical protein